jgi:twitching motility protein PilJ
LLLEILNARTSLTAVSKLFESSVQQGANEILQSSPELFQVREASAAIFRDSPELLSTLTKVTAVVDEEANAVLATIIGVLSSCSNFNFFVRFYSC